MANLSLVGVSSMVKVLCRSIPSGFHVEQFINLSIENMVLSNCSGYGNATMHLATGSKVSLEHVTITNTSGYNATGLQALDVVGSIVTNCPYFRGTVPLF